MHPIDPVDVEAYAARLGIDVEEAVERVERLVEIAVEEALRRGPAAIDIVPQEFQAVVRTRWRERVQAGESEGLVLVSSTAAPLGPAGRTA